MGLEALAKPNFRKLKHLLEGSGLRLMVQRWGSGWFVAQSPGFGVWVADRWLGA